MKRVFLLAAALSLATAGAGAGPPKQYINWAKSWSDAVAEAKALNMPIVVHRHGFY